MFSNISNIKISKYLNLPPIKIHCSMLCEDEIKDSIKNYKSKQVKNMNEIFEDL